jgi:AraC-like DNA-binding protein
LPHSDFRKFVLALWSFHDSLSEMLSRSSDHAEALAPDPLSEVLRDLRPSGVSYGHCRLSRPWGVAFAAEPSARLHFVVAGESYLRTADFGPVRLTAGDVALVPQGVAHAMTDTPRGRTKPLSAFPLEEIGDRTYRMAAGGGGSQTLMACCSVSFDEPALHPLLELMPSVLVICRATIDDPTLPSLLDAMAEEVMAQRVGAATVLARLADVVIVRLIRAWAEGSCGETIGWLAAIRDPKIGRALSALHRRPGHSWSIAALAKEAGLSRSMFSERFRAVMKTPPAQYLARWRMHLATLLLSRQHLSVSEVARRLGYESEPSFSRAFKRLQGVPPTVVRRGAANSAAIKANGGNDITSRSRDRAGPW